MGGRGGCGGEESVHKEPTRPVMNKEKTVEQTGFTLHTHQTARFHVLFGLSWKSRCSVSRQIQNKTFMEAREGKGSADERSLFLAAASRNHASPPPQILNSIFRLMFAINQFALLSFLFQWNWNAYSQIDLSFSCNFECQIVASSKTKAEENYTSSLKNSPLSFLCFLCFLCPVFSPIGFGVLGK